MCWLRTLFNGQNCSFHHSELTENEYFLCLLVADRSDHSVYALWLNNVNVPLLPSDIHFWVLQTCTDISINSNSCIKHEHFIKWLPCTSKNPFTHTSLKRMVLKINSSDSIQGIYDQRTCSRGCTHNVWTLDRSYSSLPLGIYTIQLCVCVYLYFDTKHTISHGNVNNRTIRHLQVSAEKK